MSSSVKADLLLGTPHSGGVLLPAGPVPPLTLNAFRFLTAFFVLGAIFFRKLRGISRRTLLASIPIEAVPGADVHRLHLWCCIPLFPTQALSALCRWW